jgi:hypothetical protein
MSLLFSTQLTAVATAVLGVFAIITAAVAALAFRKQSQEITLLQVQLRDQKEFDERQAGVLELQAKELAESLEERKLNRVQKNREQATHIFVWEDQNYSGMMIAHAKNASAQPIYDVEVSWCLGLTVYGTHRFDQPLLPGDERVSNSAQDASAPENVDPATLSADLWFRDAAGTSWRARPDGIVEEVPPGKEPPHEL